MAVTKIKPIKGTLNKALDYIQNPAKTDEKILVDVYKRQDKTLFLCGGQRTAGDEIVEAYDLGAYESALKVGVNLSCRDVYKRQGAT